MFNEMYKVRDSERNLFGDNWCGESVFDRATPMLIAKFEKPDGADGHDVEVYCSAAPSRFFTIKALDSTNSVGEFRKGFILETGSGMGQLTKQIAFEISQGMLGIKAESDAV